MAKGGEIGFRRANDIIGKEKAPGPKGSTVWLVSYWPSVVEQLKGHKRVFLGQVYWFSKWRKYAFFPASEVVLEEKCMGQIGEFCRTQTERLKQRARKK